MKTIMILEDGSLNFDLFRWALNGYSVIPYTFAVGDPLQNDDQQVDLLIADVGNSSVLIAIQMQSKLADLRILFTSSASPAIWFEPDKCGLRLGSVGALQIRPFFPVVLLNKVHELIGPPVAEHPFATHA